MHAIVFPGQGAQFPGMGKDLYESSEQARDLFEEANTQLGFKITDLMFEGSKEELTQTRVTQPAIFLHSVISVLISDEFKPDMVAGHSLGEFSALVANRCLSFSEALALVSKRAEAMQKACEMEKSTMAAVLGLDDELVEKICAEVDEIVVPANYNCPGQLVISGSIPGVEHASALLKEAGAKRVVPLSVGGAFHSPFMEPARQELAQAIEESTFAEPIAPIYQNINAQPSQDTAQIKQNLMDQLTGPVRWTQTVQHMIQDGANHFSEAGPGKVLQGLIKKVDRSVKTEAWAKA